MYRLAAVYVFDRSTKCLGLPPRGTPLVAIVSLSTDCHALPEVPGDAAVLRWDPYDSICDWRKASSGRDACRIFDAQLRAPASKHVLLLAAAGWSFVRRVREIYDECSMDVADGDPQSRGGHCDRRFRRTAARARLAHRNASGEKVSEVRASGFPRRAVHAATYPRNPFLPAISGADPITRCFNRCPGV